MVVRPWHTHTRASYREFFKTYRSFGRATFVNNSGLLSLLVMMYHSTYYHMDLMTFVCGDEQGKTVKYEALSSHFKLRQKEGLLYCVCV